MPATWPALGDKPAGQNSGIELLSVKIYSLYSPASGRALSQLIAMDEFQALRHETRTPCAVGKLGPSKIRFGPALKKLQRGCGAEMLPWFRGTFVAPRFRRSTTRASIIQDNRKKNRGSGACACLTDVSRGSSPPNQKTTPFRFLFHELSPHAAPDLL